MFKFKVNPYYIEEKDKKTIVLFGLQEEKVFIFNESGAVAYNAIITSFDKNSAKENYFKETKFPHTIETEQDFENFFNYLIEEKILVECEV